MAFTFLDAKGTKREENSAGDYQIVVVGEEATGETELVRMFRNDRDFRRWAGGSPVAEKFQRALDTLSKDVLPQQPNESKFEKLQALGLQLGTDNFSALAKLLGKEPGDEEVIQAAMIDKSPLTPKVFDPILLYDRRIEVEPPSGSPVDPRTSLLPVFSGFWPVLGWGGWDNRARSARVFGLNVLCENNWFGGRQAWLIGFNMLLNLYHLAFDQVTSSVAAF